jgi:hypothetical protein
MTHDDITRTGSQGFTYRGTGLVNTRNCLPGRHNVFNQAGGSTRFYRGARVWFCAACLAEREKKQVA